MAQRTQSSKAYNDLTLRIQTGEIPPGDRVVEALWAERLGVNRAAIREALTRLLGEGLVRQGVRGGFFVVELSDGDIRQIREVREILETSAFRLACDRATAKQKKLLAETCDDFANFVKKRYFAAAHEADLRFHLLLMEAANNPRLSLIYERSRIPLFHRKVAQQRAHPEDLALTEQEHRGILDALIKADKERGVARLRAHFIRGERDALA